MADPKIVEAAILHLLDEPVSFESSERLAAASTVVILDAFDRQVNREFFCGVLDNAASFQRFLVRLRCFELMRQHVADAGVVTLQQLEIAVNGATMQSDNHRRALVRQLDHMAQCPISGDTVN